MDSDDQIYFDGLGKKKYLSDRQKSCNTMILILRCSSESICSERQSQMSLSERRLLAQKRYLLDAWQSLMRGNRSGLNFDNGIRYQNGRDRR